MEKLFLADIDFYENRNYIYGRNFILSSKEK